MTPPEVATFGALLRRYRLAAGFSQEVLAERARLSVAAVSALERGHRTNPRPETVALLAEALGIGPTERSALIVAATGLDDTASGVPPGASVQTASEPALKVSALPRLPGALIGREREEAAATHLLRPEGNVRLLTLIGPGGVGKTRLAVAVATALQATYSDGVAFVDLSALRDPSLVATTIAQSLGLREEGAHGLRQQLLASLQPRHMLLVLDNVEQVVEAAPLVANLLAVCPRLAVLATSRTPLHLHAEQRFVVPPLATPEVGRAVGEDFDNYASIRLFVERARAIRPDFALDDENATAVAEICRQLDGLPLAIELAAARCALLPPVALLARLERRLPLLTGGARDLPSRQQTLRATIDWSYALLPAWEQAMFRQLSVVSGGCTLEAAEAMATPQEAGADDVLSGLETLVEQSLLRSVAQPDGEPRFRMLETIREYGLEQLSAHSEEAEAQRAHATYYQTLAGTAASRLFGSEQVLWLERLEQEHDNLRQVLVRAREREDAEQGLRLVGTLWRFWYIRCHLSEGRGWLAEFTAMPSGRVAGAAARLQALVGLAVIAYAQTDYDQAAVAAEEGVDLARTLEDQPNLVVALNILGGVARYRSEFARAVALGEECVTLTRSIGDNWSLALSLHNLADVVRLQGAYERAEALCEESLTLAQSLDDHWGVAQAMLTRGYIARDRGDLATAAAFFAASLTNVRELGHIRDIAFALAGQGHLARMQGDRDGAAALFEECLQLLRPLGDKVRTADVLTGLGIVQEARGDHDNASKLHRESLALSRAVGNRLGLAESLEGLAAVAQAQQQAERAAQLLAATAALREEIGAPITQAERPAHERLMAAVQVTLGDVRYREAWVAGNALTPNRAIMEALAESEA